MPPVPALSLPSGSESVHMLGGWLWRPLLMDRASVQVVVFEGPVVAMDTAFVALAPGDTQVRPVIHP